VQAVEILADNVRTKNRRQVWSQQNRHFAQRVLTVHSFIAFGRAGFVVDDLYLTGQASFMRKYQSFARIGGMSLVEKFHGCILKQKKRPSKASVA
jgi:hypothetical protein